AVGDRTHDRRAERLFDLGDESDQIVLSRAQKAPGQEEVAREATAEHSEDLLADIGLEAVDGQDHTACRPCHPAQAFGAGEREGKQLVTASRRLETVRRLRAYATAGQLGMDLGNVAALGMS